MTARLSPEQVRALPAGLSLGAGGEAFSGAATRQVTYRVTWMRCAHCNQRSAGLFPVPSGISRPRIIYVCGECYPSLAPEEEG